MRIMDDMNADYNVEPSSKRSVDKDVMGVSVLKALQILAEGQKRAESSSNIHDGYDKLDGAVTEARDFLRSLLGELTSMNYIYFGEKVELESSSGMAFLCDIKMARESYCGDLMIDVNNHAFKEPVFRHWLYDDETFMESIAKFFEETHDFVPEQPKECFSRGKLGLQGPEQVIIEPTRDFMSWAKKKHGWIYAGENEQ